MVKWRSPKKARLRSTAMADRLRAQKRYILSYLDTLGVLIISGLPDEASAKSGGGGGSRI